MPPSAPTATTRGRYWVFQCALPGHEENCGVALADESGGRLEFRFRRDWRVFAPEEADVLSQLPDTLAALARELGPGALLARLEDTLSNTLRISDARETLIGRFEGLLDQLYRRHVQPAVLRFETHLPYFATLAAAAGGFSGETAAEEAEWIEAPPGLRLGEDMFVLRISGRSMVDAGIPDGSLCVFRKYRGGSRAGQIVLVKRVGALDDAGALTIKRYQSEKEADAEGWRHKRITMQPDSAGHADWDLDESERYETVGVFIRVLEET